MKPGKLIADIFCSYLTLQLVLIVAAVIKLYNYLTEYGVLTYVGIILVTAALMSWTAYFMLPSIIKSEYRKKFRHYSDMMAYYFLTVDFLLRIFFE